MKRGNVISGLIVVLMAGLLWGCAGAKVDEKKPIAEIQTEAEKMDADELYRMAKAYKEAILDKRDDVEDLRDRLDDIDPDELVSAEATSLKADADAVADSIAALTERFELYVTLLKAKGGDTHKLSLE